MKKNSYLLNSVCVALIIAAMAPVASAQRNAPAVEYIPDWPEKIDSLTDVVRAYAKESPTDKGYGSGRYALVLSRSYTFSQQSEQVVPGAAWEVVSDDGRLYVISTTWNFSAGRILAIRPGCIVWYSTDDEKGAVHQTVSEYELKVVELSQLPY